jgi:hypothetical protein
MGKNRKYAMSLTVYLAYSDSLSALNRVSGQRGGHRLTASGQTCATRSVCVSGTHVCEWNPSLAALICCIAGIEYKSSTSIMQGSIGLLLGHTWGLSYLWTRISAFTYKKVQRLLKNQCLIKKKLSCKTFQSHPFWGRFCIEFKEIHQFLIWLFCCTTSCPSILTVYSFYSR